MRKEIKVNYQTSDNKERFDDALSFLDKIWEEDPKGWVKLKVRQESDKK